jgi:hypothetical protein
MTEPPPTVLEWLGLSGLLALIGAALGYGRLQQRIEQHAQELLKLSSNADTLARLDERLAHVKDDISEIKETLRGRSI